MSKATDRKIKVILMEQIKNNTPGMVISIKKGYALYLISQGKAVYFIGNEKLPESRKKELDENHAKLENQANDILNKLQALFSSKPLTIERASGMRGILYGSISAADISKELENTYQININRKNIIFNPIKVIGNYDSKINLYGNICFKLPISVIGLS